MDLCNDASDEPGRGRNDYTHDDGNGERHQRALEHHVFRERRSVVRRGRISEHRVPIFPGYVFVAAQEKWSLVRDIIGVIDFVRAGIDRGVAYVDDVVGELLSRADAEGVLLVPDVPVISRFSMGQMVRIVGAHVLAGQQAQFQRMLIGTQAVIELDWMGRMVPICIDERDLAIQERGRRRRRRRREQYVEVAA